MLGSRETFHRPSERWIQRETEESPMSPPRRNRPSKLCLPSKRILPISWEDQSMMDVQPIPSGNTTKTGRSMCQGTASLPMEPTLAYREHDGVSYIYNKGPAGQTPFPTIVAMSSYFQPIPPQPQYHIPSQESSFSNQS